MSTGVPKPPDAIEGDLDRAFSLAMHRARSEPLTPHITTEALVAASVDAAVEGKTSVESNPFLADVRKKANREAQRKRQQERERRRNMTTEERRAEDAARHQARFEAAMRERGMVRVTARATVDEGELQKIVFEIERKFAYDRRVPPEVRTRLAGIMYRTLETLIAEGADTDGRQFSAWIYVERDELELIA